MSLVRDILIAARAKVAHGWCQGQRWKTVDRRTCFCASGAIEQALQQRDAFQLSVQVRHALRTVIGGRAIALWNDEPERTQADVLAAFDRAIEATS